MKDCLTCTWGPKCSCPALTAWQIEKTSGRCPEFSMALEPVREKVGAKSGWRYENGEWARYGHGDVA